jgi:hypothetical protein
LGQFGDVLGRVRSYLPKEATVHVLHTVDLDKAVTTDQRDKFAEYLANKQWVKLALTTTWAATYQDSDSYDDVAHAVKIDTVLAAKHAGISTYEIAFMIGDRPPIIKK